jgi:type III secretion HrpO family protein
MDWFFLINRAMYDSEVIKITQQALWLIIVLAGPPVIVAAIVGILIAFVQAATQLQEQTFQYAAKFIAIVITIFITASLAGSTLYHFSDRIFSEFISLVK